MKQTYLQSYYLRRLLASDPGRKRLNQAGKATISLISAVFASTLLLNMLDHPPLLPSIIAGVCGLMGIMIVLDDTKEKKQVTTLLLPLSAAVGVTVGSLLADHVILVSAWMVTIIFCGFYFSRFGSRYFSLGMIGFFTSYFSSFLKLSPDQFPWFYLTILIGVSFAYFYNFVLFKDSVQLLKRSMNSFHRQANLTFQLLIEIIQDTMTSDSRRRKLDYNVRKLREYANNVSTDLNAQDIRELWPGLGTEQLRLYVFDTAMFVMTMSESLQKLKNDDALEMKELRTLLVKVIYTLQQAEVLNHTYSKQNLVEAENVIKSLREMIDNLFKERSSQPEGWLYLVRRIEAIATHVTEGALEIKGSINKVPSTMERIDDANVEEEEKEEEKGMKPTTKKAIQSVIAGTIAVIVGYAISPIQPYWVLLTTFIVQLGTETVGRTYLKGLERSIGTVIGAVLGFGLAKLVSGHPQLEVILLFSFIFLAFYLLPVSYTIMSLLITMLIAFMYDLMLGGITFELLGARVIDTIAGAAIALGVAAVIYPTKTMDKVSQTFADYLEELESYVTDYVRSFREPSDIKTMADHAFQLDAKIQEIEDESKPLLQGPGVRKYSGLPRWITVFTAINYYAKHLVASAYQKNFTYPDEVSEVFQRVEEKFSHNIHVLTTMIEKEEVVGELYDLHPEREQIERHAPGHNDGQGDLVHHLYYVWKINQSLIVLGKRMGLYDRN
ncbi:FUSC family protein [Halobacillus mangrovi]|uniref:FUSC family protein n=1 Tax=Halobacillus mangrovi TaxID=402384 RepID=UPI003D97B5BD